MGVAVLSFFPLIPAHTSVSWPISEHLRLPDKGHWYILVLSETQAGRAFIKGNQGRQEMSTGILWLSLPVPWGEALLATFFLARSFIALSNG